MMANVIIGVAIFMFYVIIMRINFPALFIHLNFTEVASDLSLVCN